MERKSLVPNSAHTRPWQVNSKKNSKKIKKPLPGIIFSQNGDETGREIGEKILVPYTFILDPGKKNTKNIAKKFKKLKNLFLALFLAKTT